MSEGYEEKITVKDEWKTTHDHYRLVNKGAGPDVLQKLEEGTWRDETECYVHGSLCGRIKALAKLTDAMELAWGVIANAHGGDWENASPEWKQAAEKWRDEQWHPALEKTICTTSEEAVVPVPV